MTYRRLPALVPLRSFEAAARHRGVTRAAAELSVTPGAVSRGVRALEAELGAALFSRGPSGLALTPAGEVLFAAAREGLDRIASGLAAMRRAAPGRGLRIGAHSLFASRWLIPRWKRLGERHPGLEIDIQTGAEPLELVPGRFDAVIAVTDARPRPGMAALPLLRIEVVPVCAPRLLETGHFEWGGARLLHSLQRPDDWRRWLAASGVAGPDPAAGPCFESIALALDAAAEGLGVALAIRALVVPDLASGRVVVPHPFVRRTQRWFTLLHDAGREAEPAFAALRGWLEEEAGATGRAVDRG